MGGTNQIVFDSYIYLIANRHKVFKAWGGGDINAIKDQRLYISIVLNDIFVNSKSHFFLTLLNSAKPFCIIWSGIPIGSIGWTAGISEKTGSGENRAFLWTSADGLVENGAGWMSWTGSSGGGENKSLLRGEGAKVS